MGSKNSTPNNQRNNIGNKPDIESNIAPNKECICCYNETKLRNLSKKCVHQADYCIECIQKLIQTKIEDKGQTRFVCPSPLCNVEYEPNEYFPIINKKCHDIIDKLLLNKALENIDGFRWCYNPNGCGTGQIIDNYKQLKGYYQCYSCHQLMCFKHEMCWHLGYDCKEFDIELQNNPDLRNDKIILKCTKQCPNCGTTLSKLEGCDVFTCCQYGTHGCQDNSKQFGNCDHGNKQFCGQVFCWLCLGKMKIRKNGGLIRNCKKNCKYHGI